LPGLSPEEQAVVQKLLADPALMKSYGLTATAAPQSQQPLDAPGPAKQVELTVRSMGEQSEQPKEKKKEKK